MSTVPFTKEKIDLRESTELVSSRLELSPGHLSSVSCGFNYHVSLSEYLAVITN